MKVRYLLKVDKPTAGVYNAPNTSSSKTGLIFVDDELIALELEDGWYRHNGTTGGRSPGWSMSSDFILINNLGTDIYVNDIGKQEVEENNRMAREDADDTGDVDAEMTQAEIDKLISDYGVGSGDIVSQRDEPLRDLRFIHGTPFQYGELTDPRPPINIQNSGNSTVASDGLGMVYQDAFLRDASIMLLTPGRAVFMRDFSKEFKRGGLGALLGSDDEVGTLEEMIKGSDGQEGRYYSFESDYANYIGYVDFMCNTAATMLGIGGETIVGGGLDGETLGTMSWNISEAKGKSYLTDWVSKEPSVAFYIDGNASSFSEGMSNETGASKIKGLTSGISSMAKELMFLFDDSDPEMLDLTVDALSSFGSSVSGLVTGLLGNNSGLSQGTAKLSRMLTDGIRSLNYGANIQYPDIYQDSSYGKSYDICIKAATPYGDKMSYFLNILVPMFHIIAMSYPRQVRANGYASPFLVRGFCKGLFTCSMGMITNVTIRKATNDGWTVDGLPTEVQIDITIKDMYETMSICKFKDKNSGTLDPFNNIEWMDMIANWCGVNMNEKDITRRIYMIGLMTGGQIAKIPSNISAVIQEVIANKLRNFFGT